MNKRLIILFACLALVVLVVILSTVVFTVREIEVLVPDKDSDYFDKSLIVSNSKIKMNTSIFSLSEMNSSANIELTVPYAKVVTIERVFPSTVRINIIKREGIIAVPLGDGDGIAIIDREFKVLEVHPDSSSIQGNFTKLIGCNYTAIDYKLAGTFLPKNDKFKWVAELVLAAETVSIINGRLPIFAESFDLSLDGYIIIRTVKGINIAVMTDSNLTINSQFRSLYTNFESNDSKHDKSKYIVITADGIKTLSEDEFINSTI